MSVRFQLAVPDALDEIPVMFLAPAFLWSLAALLLLVLLFVVSFFFPAAC